ncbi:unnamed protein product [Brugia timori]|uniref:Uncharacterized protein n=1 Tax=Brugia timori TaxID=42155 RepID=A0A0R3RDE9_9BILA|nr:unnamed protein product [Brugia timori]
MIRRYHNANLLIITFPIKKIFYQQLEEEVPMKSENKQTHKKRTKNNLKLKSHRGKQIRKSNSTEIDKRMISARNGSDSRSTMRSSSDTSVHCSYLLIINNSNYFK